MGAVLANSFAMLYVCMDTAGATRPSTSPKVWALQAPG
jgi:hypothetical protein